MLTPPLTDCGRQWSRKPRPGQESTPWQPVPHTRQPESFLFVEITPTLSLQQVADPKFELSLLPGPGNPGAAGMIQQVGDFLLTQDIIKAKIDGKSAVDGSWVAEHLKAKR